MSGKTSHKQCQNYLAQGKLHLRRFLDRDRSINWSRTYCAIWQRKRAEYIGAPKDADGNYIMKEEDRLCMTKGVATDNFGEEAIVMLLLLADIPDMSAALDSVFMRFHQRAHVWPSDLKIKARHVDIINALDRLAGSGCGPSDYQLLGTILDRRARIEFFVNKKILKSPAIQYPNDSAGQKMYWMQRGNLQFDGSVKGKSKKMAHQVGSCMCMLVGCADILGKTERICAPLVLQQELWHNNGKVTHMAAANRMDEILQMMLDHLGDEYALSLARNKAAGPGLHDEWFFDADQEASEQRAIHALCRTFKGVPRIGFHHRLSNISGGNKKFKDLCSSLRILTGGVASKESLRGAFNLAVDSIRKKIAADPDYRPEHAARTERETGLTLAEAFDEDRGVVSVVRTRWLGIQMVGLWSAECSGATLIILNEMKLLAKSRAAGMEGLLCVDPADDALLAQAEDGVSRENEENVDIDTLFPVADEVGVDDGPNVLEQERKESQREDAAAAVPAEGESETISQEKMNAEQKVKLCETRILAIPEDEVAHFNRLHRKPMLFHLLHLQKTHGTQQNPRAFSEKNLAEVEQLYPALFAADKADLPAVLLATSKMLPDVMKMWMGDSSCLCASHEQTLEVIHYQRLLLRFYIYERFDPAFNVWSTYFWRKGLPPDEHIKQMLLNLSTELDRDLSPEAEQFRYYLSQGEVGEKNARESITRGLICGCTSDLDGETPWRFATTAEKTHRRVDGQFRLQATRHLDWQERSTHFPVFPSFVPKADTSVRAGVEDLRKVIQSSTIPAKDPAGFREQLDEKRFRQRQDMIDEYKRMESVQNKKTISDEVERLIRGPARKICLDSAGPIEASAQTYHIPGFEIATMLLAKAKDGSSRNRKQRRVRRRLGEFVDRLTRHKDWLKKKGYLVHYDDWQDVFAFVLEINRGMYGGLKLLTDAARSVGIVPPKPELVFGFTADCSALTTYDNISYCSGRLRFDLSAPWVLFMDSLRASVPSLPNDLVVEALSEFLEVEVVDRQLYTQCRDLLVSVCIVKDMHVARSQYEVLTNQATRSFGSITDNPEYVRAVREINANRGATSAKARTFLGYVQNDFHWQVSCRVCAQKIATVHKFERRTTSAGRYLLGQYCVPVPLGKTPSPTAIYPLYVMADARISAAFGKSFVLAHQIQKTGCGDFRLKLESVQGNRKKNDVLRAPMHHAVPEQEDAEMDVADADFAPQAAAPVAPVQPKAVKAAAPKPKVQPKSKAGAVLRDGSVINLKAVKKNNRKVPILVPLLSCVM
eukprot:g4335.t1